MQYQWSRWQGCRISGTVRRASIRSAEPEERKRAHGVRDAGSAFRSPDSPCEPYQQDKQREKEAKRERTMTTTAWVTFLDELTGRSRITQKLVGIKTAVM
jgi:hypothetical protein